MNTIKEIIKYLFLAYIILLLVDLIFTGFLSKDGTFEIISYIFLAIVIIFAPLYISYEIQHKNKDNLKQEIQKVETQKEELKTTVKKKQK